MRALYEVILQTTNRQLSHTFWLDTTCNLTVRSPWINVSN